MIIWYGSNVNGFIPKSFAKVYVLLCGYCKFMRVCINLLMYREI